MKQEKNKLYLILFVACMSGYIWLYYNITTSVKEQKSYEVCLIKKATNIPCPSCGSTRSIISIFKGDFRGAIYFNPMGYLVAMIMIVSPIWIIGDTIMSRNTLFVFYHKIETYLQNSKLTIPLILLIIINWIWNIAKGL